MAAPEAWRARSCWFCEVAAATTMEATSREAAPAKSSASGPSAPPALFELCGRAVSAHMGVLESGVWGKSRGEGLPLARSGGGPATGGRGGRGREAWGKAQPRALEGISWGRSVNSVTDRAEAVRSETKPAGGPAPRPGWGARVARPGGPVWDEAGRARAAEAGLPARAVGTEVTLGLGRAAESRMLNGRAAGDLLLGGGGRGGEARPKAGRPGPGPPQLTDGAGPRVSAGQTAGFEAPEAKPLGEGGQWAAECGDEAAGEAERRGAPRPVRRPGAGGSDLWPGPRCQTD